LSERQPASDILIKKIRRAKEGQRGNAGKEKRKREKKSANTGGEIQKNVEVPNEWESPI